MIKYNSSEWRVLLRKLKKSMEKSNRDYLCVKCWSVICYRSMKNHYKFLPTHNQSTLSSKHFTSESKFIILSKDFGKERIIDGESYYESPFK